MLAARPEIVHFIQLVGGFYIAWMGMSSVRSGGLAGRHCGQGWQRICLIPKPWCFSPRYSHSLSTPIWGLCGLLR
ncbi:hypothetical protein [Corynebacterium rouxii]|uniref:hypothetical protein n=1 Tax=Corynebacterium rouxii TaxID=2719119 RepID=UPI00313A95D6